MFVLSALPLVFSIPVVPAAAVVASIAGAKITRDACAVGDRTGLTVLAPCPCGLVVLFLPRAGGAG